MKAGTFGVTVTGFLTEGDAKSFERAVRNGNGFAESGLETDFITPEVKSFKAQLADEERLIEVDALGRPVGGGHMPNDTH